MSYSIKSIMVIMGQVVQLAWIMLQH